MDVHEQTGICTNTARITGRNTGMKGTPISTSGSERGAWRRRQVHTSRRSKSYALLYRLDLCSPLLWRSASPKIFWEGLNRDIEHLGSHRRVWVFEMLLRDGAMR